MEALKTDKTGKHKYLKAYDSFVAMNYPSLLQSIVAFVTFNAYTNQTRFAWAYASEFLDRDLRIPPGTIMLSTAIAAVLYLNYYTIMDYISERDYYDVNIKILYVLCILGLLYLLNATDTIEAPVDGEEDENYTAILGDTKPFLGFLVFVGFVLYGFVYPLYTRLGCCGRCKPKTADTDDHMATVEGEDPASIADAQDQVYRMILNRLKKDGIIVNGSIANISTRNNDLPSINNNGNKSPINGNNINNPNDDEAP